MAVPFEDWTIFGFSSVSLLILQYPAAGIGGQLLDQKFASADRALGFDWLAHFHI